MSATKARKGSMLTFMLASKIQSRPAAIQSVDERPHLALLPGPFDAREIARDRYPRVALILGNVPEIQQHAILRKLEVLLAKAAQGFFAI